MILHRSRLSFSHIINMNVGGFAIHYSFGLQQSAVNPSYDFPGAGPGQMPLLNLAGSLTGLLFASLTGLGIARAGMMSIPYLIVLKHFSTMIRLRPSLLQEYFYCLRQWQPH